MMLLKPHFRQSTRIAFALFFISLVVCSQLAAQQITGVWKGKINRQKTELKIIQKGDSLTGTSYYFENAGNYRRYSIKGYFDAATNSVVWWDDQLIEEKHNSIISSPGKTPLLSVADFNCPGGGQMFLDGKAATKEEPEATKGPVDLTKVTAPTFTDEWDYIIENYTWGTNDPYLIDSVALVAFSTNKTAVPVAPQPARPVINEKRGMVAIPPMPEKTAPVAQVQKPQTIEEKFTSRKKTFVTEIPVEGDSIELRFYDNAEIDGDSISLFLNDGLLFQHIRLTDKAYTIKLPVSSLTTIDNELTMVAENLGTIPPNTSFMVAIVGDKRYEARLASTENSSALIRLKKMIPVKSATQ